MSAPGTKRTLTSPMSALSEKRTGTFWLIDINANQKAPDGAFEITST